MRKAIDPSSKKFFVEWPLPEEVVQKEVHSWMGPESESKKEDDSDLADALKEDLNRPEVKKYILLNEALAMHQQTLEKVKRKPIIIPGNVVTSIVTIEKEIKDLQDVVLQIHAEAVLCRNPEKEKRILVTDCEIHAMKKYRSIEPRFIQLKKAIALASSVMAGIAKEQSSRSRGELRNREEDRVQRLREGISEERTQPFGEIGIPELTGRSFPTENRDEWLKLEMHIGIKRVKDLESYKAEVIVDLIHACKVKPKDLKILSIRSGGRFIGLGISLHAINLEGQNALQMYRRLEIQAQDPSSKLLQGKQTCQLINLSLIGEISNYQREIVASTIFRAKGKDSTSKLSKQEFMNFLDYYYVFGDEEAPALTNDEKSWLWKLVYNKEVDGRLMETNVAKIMSKHQDLLDERRIFCTIREHFESSDVKPNNVKGKSNVIPKPSLEKLSSYREDSDPKAFVEIDIILQGLLKEILCDQTFLASEDELKRVKIMCANAWKNHEDISAHTVNSDTESSKLMSWSRAFNAVTTALLEWKVLKRREMKNKNQLVFPSSHMLKMVLDVEQVPLQDHRQFLSDLHQDIANAAKSARARVSVEITETEVIHPVPSEKKRSGVEAFFSEILNLDAICGVQQPKPLGFTRVTTLISVLGDYDRSALDIAISLCTQQQDKTSLLRAGKITGMSTSLELTKEYMQEVLEKPLQEPTKSNAPESELTSGRSLSFKEFCTFVEGVHKEELDQEAVQNKELGLKPEYMELNPQQLSFLWGLAQPTDGKASEDKLKYAIEGYQTIVKSRKEFLEKNSPPKFIPFVIRLQIEMDSIANLAKFKHELAIDVASAAGISHSLINTVSLQTGSIIATMEMSPKAKTVNGKGPEDILKGLEKQAGDPSSTLLAGKHTSRTLRVSTPFSRPLEPDDVILEQRKQAAMIEMDRKKYVEEWAKTENKGYSQRTKADQEKILAETSSLITQITNSAFLRSCVVHNAMYDELKPYRRKGEAALECHNLLSRYRIDFWDFATQHGYIYEVASQCSSDGVMMCYQGTWLNGEMHGLGTCTYMENGEYCGKYTGQFERNRRSGKGAFLHADEKTVYAGSYIEDKKDGWGKLFFPNGSRYEGSFSNDIMHGNGIFFTRRGKRYEGVWKFGKAVTQGEGQDGEELPAQEPGETVESVLMPAESARNTIPAGALIGAPRQGGASRIPVPADVISDPAPKRDPPVDPEISELQRCFFVPDPEEQTPTSPFHHESAAPWKPGNGPQQRAYRAQVAANSDRLRASMEYVNKSRQSGNDFFRTIQGPLQ